ncbi:hypothetical protein B0T14DRAFT_517285 [Immersiella caudata]|uniref:Uncharacterized protein n=1 Tax=Immersiella caudata TaxID=314043 RepID=A0AA39WYG2_9PEZI|nr:hypothetical protein B0T14DRAFT_517285 [Immersiella caudata]
MQHPDSLGLCGSLETKKGSVAYLPGCHPTCPDSAVMRSHLTTCQAPRNLELRSLGSSHRLVNARFSG